MTARLATYFTYAEFNSGKACSVDDFRRELSRFKRSRVVYLASVINCLLRAWEGEGVDLNTHDLLVNSAFPPEVASRLIAASRSTVEQRIVFHRQQALFLAKECIQNCNEEGVDPLSSPYWGRLGVPFLMANDLLPFYFSTPQTAGEKTIQLLAQFIPIVEYSAWHSFHNKIIRAYLMQGRFVEKLRNDKVFVDLNAEFSKLTGIGLPEYYALCFGVLSKYMGMDLDTFKQDPKRFLLPTTWFHSAAISADKVISFRNELVADAETLKENFKRRDFGPNDFTGFRDRPLFTDGANLYATDTAFLAEKSESGVFWRVHNSLKSNKERERLHSFWGRVFQEYLNCMLFELVNGEKNIFLPSPNFAETKEEICDAILVCGWAVVLIEFKGNTFTAEAKYSGNPEVLSNEINEKLIGTVEKKKGVRQLVASIIRLFDKHGNAGIEGIDLSNVRTIYPVIVTRDDLGGSFLINRLLNETFESLLDRSKVKPYTVRPLICLSAEAFEYVAAFLNDLPLSDILEARLKAEPMLKSTFIAVDNRAIAKVGQRRNIFLQRAFDEFSENHLRILFPDEAKLASEAKGEASPSESA